MTKINLLVLTPLLRMAVDRYGEEVAQLVGSSTAAAIVWEALDMAKIGHAHIERDRTSKENEFAAERLEESAMMLLCAAKMLRGGTIIHEQAAASEATTSQSSTPADRVGG